MNAGEIEMKPGLELLCRVEHPRMVLRSNVFDRDKVVKEELLTVLRLCAYLRRQGVNASLSKHPIAGLAISSVADSFSSVAHLRSLWET